MIAVLNTSSLRMLGEMIEWTFLLEAQSCESMESVRIVFYVRSAIIEHTNQVIFMEDDDLAVVRNGALTIHRTQHEVTGQSTIREIIELKIELQEIMKGTKKHHDHIFLWSHYFFLQEITNTSCRRKSLNSPNRW